MEEKVLANIRKHNMKLYPIYKMIGLDWIFYYGVEILFLTQVKQIEPADIVLASGIFALFCIIFQIPSVIILEKVGKKNGIVLGQVITAIAMLVIMLCPNFVYLIVAKILSSFGFSIRGIAESNFLNSSIPQTKKKGEIFAKIDEKGYSRFCYIGATSVLISGFLYSINPYIPVGLCLAVNILSVILAMNFIDIEKLQDKKQKKKNLKESMKQTGKEVKESFRFVMDSTRIKTLLMMSGIIWGLISLMSSYQETVLKELNIPSYYIGIILAAFQLLVGIFSTKSIDFHNKFHNKSMTMMGLLITIGSIIVGIVVLLPLPFAIQLMFIIVAFIARAYAKGVYQINKKRYMGNFANKKVLPEIYSMNGIYCNFTRMIFSFIGSMLLRITNTANASILAGILFTVLMTIAYFYAKTRLGLKPEQYLPREICPELVEK
ncbi:MAG: MFS transporter [Clostridia bacterium]|jgi:MFS family permease|nr:MFS transporter [Clostridia bacterium]